MLQATILVKHKFQIQMRKEYQQNSSTDFKENFEELQFKNCFQNLFIWIRFRSLIDFRRRLKHKSTMVNAQHDNFLVLKCTIRHWHASHTIHLILNFICIFGLKCNLNWFNHRRPFAIFFFCLL